MQLPTTHLKQFPLGKSDSTPHCCDNNRDLFPAASQALRREKLTSAPIPFPLSASASLLDRGTLDAVRLYREENTIFSAYCQGFRQNLPRGRKQQNKPFYHYYMLLFFSGKQALAFFKKSIAFFKKL